MSLPTLDTMSAAELTALSERAANAAKVAKEREAKAAEEARQRMEAEQWVEGDWVEVPHIRSGVEQQYRIHKGTRAIQFRNYRFSGWINSQYTHCSMEDVLRGLRDGNAGPAFANAFTKFVTSKH